MRTKLMALFLLGALAAPVAAHAQDSHDHDGSGHERSRSGTAGQHREVHRDYRQEHRAVHRSGAGRREHRQFHRDVNRDHREVHQDTHREVHRDVREEHRDVHREGISRRGHRQVHRELERDHRRYHNDWDHGWRRDSRYDWYSYRQRYGDLYRSRYYDPFGSGYGYRRFSTGFDLGSRYYSSRYWINDPWRYRLPPVSGAYRWVQYYNDVLLVDLRSGRVVDVIYDFFW